MGAFQFATAPIAGHLVGRVVSDVDTRPKQPPIATSQRLGRAFLFVQATVLWVILWRDLSPGVLVAGAAIGAAMALILGQRQEEPLFRVRALGVLARYLGSLARSNIRTAVQVLRMSPSDSTETVTWCDLDTRATTSAVFTANALTFSPGTLTLEVSETTPYRIAVHALGRTEQEVADEIAALQSNRVV